MLEDPVRIILRRVLRKETTAKYRPIFIRFRKIWYVTHLHALDSIATPHHQDMPFDQQLLNHWPMIERRAHKLLALCNTEVTDIKKLLNLFGLVIHPSGATYNKAKLHLISYDAFKASFQGEGILGYVMEFNATR